MNEQERHDLLMREIRLLHQKIDAVQRTPLVMRHGWLRHFIKDLEYNPKTQYKVHLVAMWIWTASMLTVVLVFFLASHFWALVSVLYLVCISLYANWATDYGAMSAALAAMGQPPLPEVPLETHVEPDGDADAVNGVSV